MNRKFLYRDITVFLPDGPAPTGMHFTVDEIMERSANGLPIPTSSSGKEMSFDDYTEDEWEDMECKAAQMDELKMQKMQDFYKNKDNKKEKDNNKEDDKTESDKTDDTNSSENNEGDQFESSAE